MLKKKKAELPESPEIPVVKANSAAGIHVVVPKNPERLHAILELAKMGSILASALLTCTHVEITGNYITGADCGIKIDTLDIDTPGICDE